MLQSSIWPKLRLRAISARFISRRIRPYLMLPRLTLLPCVNLWGCPHRPGLSSRASWQAVVVVVWAILLWMWKRLPKTMKALIQRRRRQIRTHPSQARMTESQVRQPCLTPMSLTMLQMMVMELRASKTATSLGIARIKPSSVISERWFENLEPLWMLPSKDPIKMKMMKKNSLQRQTRQNWIWGISTNWRKSGGTRRNDSRSIRKQGLPRGFHRTQESFSGMKRMKKRVGILASKKTRTKTLIWLFNQRASTRKRFSTCFLSANRKSKNNIRKR
mmetsp:Transcript_11179/g.19102  ORF Transcript_11179/g.19102 Transcript_11179/m.19102 type:complete len:275 (-) Transcript_11179:441-1265(-)